MPAAYASNSSLTIDARQGHFDVILAKNQSRFSRNFLHIEQYLHRELLHLNIRFIGVTDGVDTGKINNIAVRRSGKKTRQIYALVNEWYCQPHTPRIVLLQLMPLVLLISAYVDSLMTFDSQMERCFQ